MKKIILVLAIFVLAALGISAFAIYNSSAGNFSDEPDKYEKLWKDVKDLEYKDLPKSALDKVEAILSLATKEHNDYQQIKATTYKAKFLVEASQDGNLKALDFLEEQANVQEGTGKHICNFLIGAMYQNYYSRNRYSIDTRSVVSDSADSKGSRLEFYDKNEFKKQIISHYKLAVNADLKKVEANEYKEFFSDLKAVDDFFPTLFDKIAYSVIKQLDKLNRYYYSNTNLDDSFFCDANDFLKLKIENSDENAEMASLYIMQQMLSENQSNNTVFSFVDYMRIKYSASRQRGKDDKIMELYNDAAKKYAGLESVIFINAEIAEILSEKSSKDLVDAVKLLESTVAQFKDSKYISICSNKLEKIKFPELHINTEKIVHTDENIPIHIEYANIDKVKVKVVKISGKASDFDDFRNTKDAMEKLYTSKGISETTITLPEAGDYSTHSTYYVVNGLPYGFYAIFIGTENGEQIKYSLVSVSQFALLKIDEAKYVVIDRISGQPVSNAKVKVTVDKYKNTETLLSTETSANGEFAYDVTKSDYYYTKISVKKGDDDMLFRVSDSRYFSNDNRHSSIKLLTDRAIYRPGQTVYFKAIEYSGSENEYKVIANDTIFVKLNDVNSKEVSSLTVVTNRFGSASGSFRIPDDVLTGNFSINARGSGYVSGYQNIKVEEYKRPTFEIEMDAITDEVSFGDSVCIKGRAVSYSGIPLSDATVNFNVNCSSYSRWWWRGGSDEKKHLADGTLTTDENGEFTICFVAKECFNDVNRYKVDVVVADINGESHTAEKSLSVSRTSLWVSCNISGTNELSEFKNFKIYSENISGNHIDAIVEYKIDKLAEPSRTTVSTGKTTDRNMYSREEWEKLCPALEYDNENSLENRKVQSSILKGTANTADTTPIAFGKNAKLTAGSYMITLKSKDKDGNQVYDTSYFHITDKSSKAMPYVAPSYFELTQSSANIGDKVKMRFGSSFKDVKVYYTIQIGKDKLDVKTIDISNEIKDIEIPITEKCYGNVNITAIFVRNGRSFSCTKTISVERKNKQLDVDLVTFRDKTLPGSEESWQIKITDKNGKPADAELAATIYDASLDSYASHSWGLWPYSSNYTNYNFSSTGFESEGGHWYEYKYPNTTYETTPYPEPYFFNAINAYYSAYTTDYKSGRVLYRANAAGAAIVEEEVALKSELSADEAVLYGDAEELEISEEESEAFDNAEVRTNFNETAYFASDLVTDKDGNIFIKFTMPESLTRWNMFGLAHTSDMKIGSTSTSIITQKKVSVTPNLPRFMREGDEMYISAKIANMTENAISGKAKIEFISTENSDDITSKFLKNNMVSFSADANRNTSVEWKIAVPMSLGSVSVRIVAIADGHSDGEEKVLPILTNRMMVTETMPLPVRRAGTTNFSFKSMKDNNSNTLENYSYTLEFTSNPAWYAVLALPYMMEYPYECAEQTFSRIYSNLIASHVANSDPKIKTMFEAWKNTNAETMKSNLQRNEELKAVILENSPWLLDAESEAESKQNIGILFDMNRIKAETKKATEKLSKMQKPNGGWPWFDGMKENLYITQHIVGNYGHLKKLGVKFPDSSMEGMIKKAIKYTDREIREIYNWQMKDKHLTLGYLQIHYLYVRSFYLNDYPLDKSEKKVFDDYMKLAEKEWVSCGYYMRGMLGLAMNRSGRTATAKSIVASLKEYAQHSEELGMYWDLERGWYWYNSGIETQALLIEFFEEMGEHQDVNDMKVWLLKQKQTNRWKSTKATAEAVYALMLDGKTILTKTDYPKITLGTKMIDLATEKTDEGTGYYKKMWKKDEISKSWSEVSVTKADSTVAWGSIYWQYYEDIDKIKGFEDTPLKIRKDLFVNRVENGKEVIVPITQQNAKLKVGDKVTVRIEIEVDRNMEYVHLKDMRASAFEPTEKLSGYRFKNALGYYQAIKDASVNFFIDILPKGTYVFEYQVIATQKGNFSNGITTIQSMYAPEYTSHSKGIRVTVE